MHAAAAVTALADSLDPVAAAAGMSPAQLRHELAADPSMWVDPCGSLFYVETAPPAASEPAPEGIDPDPDQALALHSRPGSDRTLLLDFDGHYISGTAWNAGYSLPAWTAPAFSTDADPASFSEAERRIIAEVWARVSEDFAPFDVDVTTVDPGESALARTSTSDQRFGARALISPDAKIAAKCGSCGGVAYLNVFDSVGGTYYAPAWVLSHRLGNSARYMAEAASHEVGHNFGLYHDGLSKDGTTKEYYEGSGDWAPIMGVGYYQRITQWSRGEYSGATRTEDDTAVISGGGAPWTPDDLPDNSAAAEPISDGLETTGLIGGRADIDWVSFTGAGSVTVTAAPSADAPNLDLRVVLADEDGELLADSDPAFVASKWPGCMGATITATLPTRGRYAIGISGVGNGLPGTDGATDYGSLGRYRVTIALPSPEIQTPTIPTLTAGAPFIHELLAAGGSLPYAWSLSAGSLPAGLALDGSRITGTPTAAGSSSATLKLTDALGQTDSQTIAFAVAEALRLSRPPSRDLTVGQSFEMSLSPSGGVPPYSWTLAGVLPPGLELVAGRISGTPTTAGTYHASVAVTDANGATAPAGIELVVRPASPPPPAPVSQVASPKQDEPSPTQALAPAPQAASPPPAPARAVASPALALAAPKSATLPTARRKRSYQATLLATGGTAPLSWQLVSGKLPKGLALDAAGQLSGTPRKKGSSKFTVVLSDHTGASARTVYRIKVR